MIRDIKYIEKIVCEELGVDPDNLHTKRKDRRFSEARQMIICFAYQYGYSGKEAGVYFERHRTSAIAANKAALNLRCVPGTIKEHYSACQVKIIDENLYNCWINNNLHKI